jgi:hypothetical protein
MLSDQRTFDNGHDGALLDGRRALETVGVDSAQELALEVHGVEAVGGLIVVGFDLGWWREAVSMLLYLNRPAAQSCSVLMNEERQ